VRQIGKMATRIDRRLLATSDPPREVVLVRMNTRGNRRQVAVVLVGACLIHANTTATCDWH